MKKIVVLSVVSLLGVVLAGCDDSNDSLPTLESKQALGDALFHDKALSKDGTQSCATCHDPKRGFADPRGIDGNLSATPYAASLGDDAHSLGDRNAPTAAYAALSPRFAKGIRQRQGQQQVNHGSYKGYLGGQFWDGREADLKGQAGGPPTNALEMGMANKAAVVDVLMANSNYVEAFEYFYGADIFNDASSENPAAYEAMADAIAQFETLDVSKFSPFNSKYDKSLIIDSETFQSEYTYSGKAEAGRLAFFSSDFACAACHQSKSLRSKKEPFTSFEYHNIGVPVNTELNAERLSRGLTQVGDDTTDLGLFKNPNVAAEDKESSKGKFKVPTLRNIAVTAPYMHNGVFDTLKAVLAFYKHADLGSAGNVTNPDDNNQAFDAPEVAQNISTSLLAANDDDKLTDENLEAIECFLLTLTDEKYEHLLDLAKVQACNI